MQISYKEGIDGNNVLILKENDVKIITDLMMGGAGEVDDSEPLSELHLSAIGEAMNQMMGLPQHQCLQCLTERLISVRQQPM